MKQFIANLKQQAVANPVETIAVLSAVAIASAKLIDAGAHARGSNAYAKDANRRAKIANKK